ncbi:MAG: hypothetical protein MUO42_01650 [Anaerolineaceae bacterium]|nr:hypothetical protein [Anaerolineaceae bacterium]
MKNHFNLAIVFMSIIILGGCGRATSQSAGGIINPGDKIGDFFITKGKESGVSYGWELDQCVHQDDKKINWCPVVQGTTVNISLGIYDDTFTGKLDSLWSEHKYEMFIAGRPVNLKAFGSIDVNHPAIGKMRYWNVVLTTDKPGEIIVSSKGIMGSNPIDDTTTYSFSAP